VKKFQRLAGRSGIGALGIDLRNGSDDVVRAGWICTHQEKMPAIVILSHAPAGQVETGMNKQVLIL
jgi:hypothetical protein